jgi:preprotein translocase SecE subunit
MRHVVWPNKRQALAYTIAIIAFTVVVAIILGAFDYLFAELVKRIVE